MIWILAALFKKHNGTWRYDLRCRFNLYFLESSLNACESLIQAARHLFNTN